MFGRTKSEHEKREQKVIELLFPPLLTEHDRHNNVFHVDRSIDTMLQAVAYDLADGVITPNNIDILRNAIGRLAKVRSILQAYPKIDRRAQYIFTEQRRQTTHDDFSSIIPREENSIDD